MRILLENWIENHNENTQEYIEERYVYTIGVTKGKQL